MGKLGQITFANTSWDERTWDGNPHTEVTGAKVTHAAVKTNYAGDLEGTSTLQYLMGYVGEGSIGSFIGMEQITGSLGGRKGTFVVLHSGTFDAEGVKGNITVVPDSGTGELKGLRGTGAYDLVGHHDRYPLTLDYDFG